MLEIERKFLVTSAAYKQQASSNTRIIQGFLSTHPDRTVRVRVRGEQGYLTIKGKSNAAGTTRFEWEQEIPLADAEALLRLCEPGTIEKIRYAVPVGAHVFEVDEFAGDNQGLVIAEVELRDEAESFAHPEWLGVEVTGDVRYYNSRLVKQPFRTWQ